MGNRNVTILKWSVVILAILNIFFVVNNWKRSGPALPPGDPEGPAKMIISELKFTQAQIQDFEKLKEAHQQAIRKLRKEGRELRNHYFDLLKLEVADSVRSEELVTAIANNQKNIETVTFDHFKEVRKLCDADQKKHFDEIIGDILSKMARPHGPPPHGNGPPEHGPGGPGEEGPPHP